MDMEIAAAISHVARLGGAWFYSARRQDLARKCGAFGAAAHRRAQRGREGRSAHSALTPRAWPAGFELTSQDEALQLTGAAWSRLPTTSTSTRRSGCRHAINFGVRFSPGHSSGLVTGSEPSAPRASIFSAGTPAVSTR